MKVDSSPVMNAHGQRKGRDATCRNVFPAVSQKTPRTWGADVRSRESRRTMSTPAASRAGVTPATTGSRLRASGSWFARGARDRDDAVVALRKYRAARTSSCRVDEPPGPRPRGRVGDIRERPSLALALGVPRPPLALPHRVLRGCLLPDRGAISWASRGLTAGTGLKPLNVDSDWLEQDGPDDPEHTWLREMRLRHELIDADIGCVVWEDDAAPAAEALLPDDGGMAPRQAPRIATRATPTAGSASPP